MDKQLVVLLSRQRSGTNALRAVLESHADVHCVGEVLSYSDREQTLPHSFISYAKSQSARYADPANHVEMFDEFLQELQQQHSKRYTVIDLKYSSCHHVSAHWKFLTQSPVFDWIMTNEVPIIRLRRNNYLRVSLSEEVARLRNQWHDRPGIESPKMDVVLPRPKATLRELFRQLRTWELEDLIVSETFEDYPNVLELHYSQMFPVLNTPISDRTLKQVCKFLKIENKFVTDIWCRKSNQRPLWECVTNWTAICKYLKGTQFEPLLADEPMFHQENRKVA